MRNDSAFYPLHIFRIIRIRGNSELMVKNWLQRTNPKKLELHTEEPAEVEGSTSGWNGARAAPAGRYVQHRDNARPNWSW